MRVAAAVVEGGNHGACDFDNLMVGLWPVYRCFYVALWYEYDGTPKS